MLSLCHERLKGATKSTHSSAVSLVLVVRAAANAATSRICRHERLQTHALVSDSLTENKTKDSLELRQGGIVFAQALDGVH